MVSNDQGNFPLTAAIIVGFTVVAGLGFFAGKATSGQGLNLGFGGSAQTQAQQNVPDIVIKPGNPTVAKIGESEIKRVDVLNYIQTLPPQTRQLPIAQLFPVALEQVINNQVITSKAEDINLDNDPKVKEQLATIKKNVVREVYLQNAVEEKITDERLQEAYTAYTSNFPEINEARARHILVENRSEARDILKQLEEGADFAALATEKSIDATAENGGEIGYFAANEVVPEFGKAVFEDAKVGEVTGPIKTEFGFHIVEVLEKRQRPPATFEQAKPFLEAQLRQLFLNQTVQEWKQQAGIERFDING
ncbi:MAG: peptidylprolyl isomerase, partial [Pseudomonadota bacterium]